MKKHLLLLLSLLLTTTMLFAERVSQSDAATVASNFLNGAVTSTKKSKAVTPNRMTLKTAAAASESQYYVYENPDGGWVMVSASDVLQPILAYSKTGTFSFENQPDNVKKWLGKYEDLIKKVEADGVEASAEASAQWNALKKSLPDDPAGTVIVGPLVQTKWDQDIPYDFYTPGTGSYGSGTKAAVGCVATAMAQVMNYWQWPVNGTGSHKYQPDMDIWEENESTGEYEYKETIVIFEGELEADFENTTYQWAKMKNSYSSDYSADPDRAVATLMSHCGIAVDMQYGGSDYDGSGALTINYNDDDELCAQNALWKYFRYKKDGLVSYKRDGYIFQGTTYYNSWTDAAWTAMVKEELDKQHPIMYDGSGTGGHSFICDGYDSKDYFHFNWGWSGSNDGWYKLNNLVPGSGGAGGGSYSFSEDQSVIIGIVPDKPTVPVDITWNIQGTITTETLYVGDKLTFDRPADVNGKTFVGWTTDPSFSGTDAQIAALITTSGTASITEAATYYAVFATATDGGSGSAAYTFTAKNWTATLDGNAANWTSGKDGAGFQNSGVQVTAKTTGANATCPDLYSGITSIVVSYCTNTSKGAGSIVMNVNGTEVTQNVSAPSSNGTSARDLTFDFSATKPSGAPQITVNCTTNSIYACGVTINYNAVTYADYTLSPSTAVVTKYVLAGENGPLTTWAPADAPQMTVSGTTATLAFTDVNVDANTLIAYKVVVIEGSNETWKGDPDNGDDNYTYLINDAGVYNFTFSYDITNERVTCDVARTDFTDWTITLVEIPNGWGSDINLYAWREDGDGITDGDNNSFAWPGIAMTKNRGTTYTATVRVYGSNPVANIIFNDGTNQTVDIEGITGPGHFRVNSTTEDAKYTANEVYKVSLAELSHGEISGLSTWYAAGDEVSFTATPDENYSLSSLTVKEDESGNEVSVSGGKFTMPAADVTLAAVFAKESAKVTVTWSVDGKTTPVQFNEGDALVLPTAPDACDNGKVFVGWTEATSVNADAAPADLFTKAGDKTVTGNLTYHAVFATATESVGPETDVTLWSEDFSDFAADDVPTEPGSSTVVYGSAQVMYACADGGSATKIYNDALAQGEAPELLVSKKNGTFTISGIPTAGAKSMSLSFKANKTTISVSTSTGDLTVSGSGSAWTLTVADGQDSPETFDITIKNTGSQNARIDDITITCRMSIASVSYSDYSLDCEGGSVDPEEVNLIPTNAQAWYYADYSTSGSHNWVMNFADGDIENAAWTFNMQIEVNTAEANALAGSYDENDGVVIGLPDETHTVLMDGLKTIEGKEVSLKLTYNSKDAAGNPTYDVVISFLGDDGKLYKINKEALAIIAKDVDSEELIDLYGDTATPLTKHEIVYYTCGEQWTKQSYYDGDILWFPSNPPAQNGKAFVGWTTAEHYTGAAAPTFVEEGTEVHASANYYAIYK